MFMLFPAEAESRIRLIKDWLYVKCVNIQWLTNVKSAYHHNRRRRTVNTAVLGFKKC